MSSYIDTDQLTTGQVHPLFSVVIYIYVRIFYGWMPVLYNDWGLRNFLEDKRPRPIVFHVGSPSATLSNIKPTLDRRLVFTV